MVGVLSRMPRWRWLLLWKSCEWAHTLAVRDRATMATNVGNATILSGVDRCEYRVGKFAESGGEQMNDAKE